MKLAVSTPRDYAPTFPVSAFNTETDDKQLACEASTLRLAPGQWPKTFTLVGDREPMSFTLVDADTREGDITAVNYRQVGGGNLTARIFND